MVTKLKLDMSKITLDCGCQITSEGKVVVSENCKYCKECNLVAELHPFGTKRLN